MVGNADVLSHRRKLLQAIGGGFAAALLAGMLVFAPRPFQAFAENIDTNPAADAFQQQVEETAAAYNEAVEEAKAAAEALEDNKKRIAELEREIPKQQVRSEAAARELYKVLQQRVGIVELLLSADNFFDFLSNLDYIDRITTSHMEQIQLLASMKSELDEKQAGLEKAKADADTRELEAKAALAAAQQARVEAQQRAQAAARGGYAGSSATSQSGTTFSTAPSDTAATASDMNQANPSPADDGGAAGGEVSAPEPEVVDDGANWMSEEDVFVSEWAGRIDAYLAGSPLAGQGATFARAAWNYGVDPRWSPAISCLESSKGAYCFLPYNAWGWGSVSWGSWEEAIDAHVRGLARGYGYTISRDAAYKYCPPNAEYWYDFVSSQMNMI